ncbi:hypothetical protein Tco_0114849, partial [Tanacetum coccineum]
MCFLDCVFRLLTDDSTTSTIVDEFESLLGDIIKQKEELKGISDPVARRKAYFLDNFKITNQGRVIHSPKKATISAISHIFPNNNFEDSFTMGSEDLNVIPNKELDKEILIPIPRESKIGKDCDFPSCDDFQSFKTFSNPLFEKEDIFEKEDDFPSRNDESILKEETLKSYLNPLFENDEEIISNEASSIISPKIKTIVSFFAPIGNCVRKWATSEFEKDNVDHEVFKSNNENVLGIHDNEEEEIAFLDSLLEDENFFEMNDKKDESFESKTKEDFETKVEPEKKKELQVFHPDIETLNHLEINSYVGSDYVFYEDFNLVDMIFPMNIQGKIFDPGISHFDKDAFNDIKSCFDFEPVVAVTNDFDVLNDVESFDSGEGENVDSLNVEEEDSFTFTIRSFLPFVTYPEVLPASYSTGSEDKVFNPGIFDNDAFKDKSSKKLAPSKALLTLDVFDPLHPPLMNFSVTKAFSGFTFSLLKLLSKKFFEPGIKNAT